MKKTLYDLLEVSPQASPETIRASFQRLIADLNLDAPENSGNQDMTNHFVLLKDAYATLSNPARRVAYDQSLAAKESIAHAVEIEPFWNGRKIFLALALLAVTAGFVSWRQVEAEKIKAEEERLKAEQIRAAQESEETRLEREKLNAQVNQNAEFERARREADMRQRQNEYAEQAAQRQALYQKQSEERKRLMEEREEERKARQQKYEDERRLRQLEYEQSRTPNKVVVLPK